MFLIKSSPTNFVSGFRPETGLLTRTTEHGEAKQFKTEAEAREWWEKHSPTLPPLPPIGQGETIQLVRR